jgi:hypothetical protein
MGDLYPAEVLLTRVSFILQRVQRLTVYILQSFHVLAAYILQGSIYWQSTFYRGFSD